MTKQEIQAKVAAIRALIAEHELDEATEQLQQLANNFDEDTQDEALTISAKWNKLEREIRNSLIRAQEAEVQRNQLIDQMLDFARELESGQESSEKRALKIPFILSLVVLILGVGFFFYKKRPAPEKAAKNCGKLYEEAQYYFYQKEYEVAKKAFLNIQEECPKRAKAGEWLVKIEDALARESTSVVNRPSTDVPDSYETIVTDPNKTMTTKSASNSSYGTLLAEGKTAFNQQDYELAMSKFKAARVLKNTVEVDTKIRETTERLYRQFFAQGMDFFNKNDYANAKKAFLIAQSHRDILQVRSMIKKCEELR